MIKVCVRKNQKSVHVNDTLILSRRENFCLLTLSVLILGVYTKNRNFRIFKSTKIGKDSHLILSSQNTYEVCHKCILRIHSIPHGDSQFFLCPVLVTRRKTSFYISLPSSKLTISLISIHEHYASAITGPSSMQDACHMNFVIDLAHRGVSVAQW